MLKRLILTTEVIDPARLAAEQSWQRNCGAVVTFTGVVRDTEAGEPITALEYECFREMAEHQLELLFRQLSERWPLASLRLVHRLGIVPAGEPSLWVQITAPHRQEAFAACEWLIDEMKKVVPIWKKPLKAPVA